MNITARQLINSDLGKMIEFAIWDAENMSDLHVTGKLETYQHFTYRENREPVTRITFAGILSGKESRMTVHDNTPITIQEGQ